MKKIILLLAVGCIANFSATLFPQQVQCSESAIERSSRITYAFTQVPSQSAENEMNILWKKYARHVGLNPSYHYENAVTLCVIDGKVQCDIFLSLVWPVMAEKVVTLPINLRYLYEGSTQFGETFEQDNDAIATWIRDVIAPAFYDKHGISQESTCIIL